jgi:hypothetical protein
MDSARMADGFCLSSKVFIEQSVKYRPSADCLTAVAWLLKVCML